MKYIFLILLLFSWINAKSITDKYPSYSYVFQEFDVEKSYINNADFIEFITQNEKYLRGFYRRSLKKGKEILPAMKGMLVGEGVSDLFLYLSMIESGFSTHAVSPKKAVGLWQFMPKTAKHYHLNVCKSNDERCDVAASTSAAIRYLNKLHREFGKWYLAAMAYNCGEGCIKKAIQKVGSDDLTLLIDDTLGLVPKETRSYMKKILLIAMIGENNTIGATNLHKNSFDHRLTEVNLDVGTSLKTVAKVLKMGYKELLKLNPSVKNGKKYHQNKKFKLMIPMDKIFAFYLRYELLENSQTQKPHLISHYVLLGDTLEQLAKRYHTSIEEIKFTNHLNDNFLVLDQILVIPVDKVMFESLLLGTSK